MDPFLVALDHGGKADPLWAVTAARGGAAHLAAVAAVTRPSIMLRRRALPALLFIGLLIAAADVLFTSATTLGYLSVVGVFGWLNPAITLIWAGFVLHERLRLLQLDAAVLLFTGSVCLSLG